MASVSTHGNQEKGPHLPPMSKQVISLCICCCWVLVLVQQNSQLLMSCQIENPRASLAHLQLVRNGYQVAQEHINEKETLPFSLVSMLITQGLVHQGYLAANPRFGSLPKVALAGLLGFGLGKASYIGVCQKKFHSFEDQLRGAGFGPEHNRHCLLTCEECKTRRGLSEKRGPQPSAS